MILASSQFLFSGRAGLYSQVASSLIASSQQTGDLASQLGDIWHSLAQATATPELLQFTNTIEQYVNAVEQEKAEQAQSLQSSLATLVGGLPDEMWRSIISPHLDRRDRDLAYIVDAQTVLRKMTATRSYVMSGTHEEKAFIRYIMGTMKIFLGEVDQHNEMVVAGMAEEVAAQMQDPLIQSVTHEAGIRLPSPYDSVAIPQQQKMPVVDDTASEPPEAMASPNAESPNAEPSAPDRKSEPPFDYHPESATPINRNLQEMAIQLAQRNLIQADIDWPYDFVRWVRSLYLWATDLPNGEAKKALSNLTKSLARLNSQATIDIYDLRRLLGPSAVNLGRPLPGMPKDWPEDMTNDLGSAVITIWDRADVIGNMLLRSVADQATLLWGYAAGQSNEKELRSDLRSTLRSVERYLLKGERVDAGEVLARLGEITKRLPKERREALGVGEDELPPLVPLDAGFAGFSQAEWIKEAQRFLRQERQAWGSVDEAGQIAQLVQYIDKKLRAVDPASREAASFLTLLFHLSLTYRRMLGVSGEAALALGLEAGSRLGAADLARSFEEMSAVASRPELLREWAEEAGHESSSYQSVLGDGGLIELVERYVSYLEMGATDASERASLEFVRANPQLKLYPQMVATILGYFIGIPQEPLDVSLLKSFLEDEEMPEAEATSVEIEKSELGMLFSDVDPDKYTPYGRVFIKAVATHRPSLGRGKPRIFITYVTWLEKIHRLYREEVSQAGQSHFDNVYDKAIENSQYLREASPEMQLKYREEYRSLFAHLLRFLDQHRDVADLVEVSLLTGDRDLRYPRRREGIHVAGTAETVPQEIEIGAEPVESAIPKTELSGTERQAPAVGYTPAIPEENFSSVRSVEPTDEATDESDNPFLGEETRLAVDLPPVLAAAARGEGSRPSPSNAAIDAMATKWGLDARHRAVLKFITERFGDEIVLQALQNIDAADEQGLKPRDWFEIYVHLLQDRKIKNKAKERLQELLYFGDDFRRLALILAVFGAPKIRWTMQDIFPKPLRMDRKYGRYVTTVEAQGEGKPVVVTRPPMDKSEELYKEDLLLSSGASVVLWGPTDEVVDIGTAGNKIIGDFALLRQILKGVGVVASKKRTSQVLIVDAPDITHRARLFFFSQHPQGTIVVWQRDRYSIHRLANWEGDQMEEHVDVYMRNGEELHDDIAFTSAEIDLDVKTIGETDWHPETHRQIEQPSTLAIRRLQDLDAQDEAVTLKQVRDRAIYAVGFLKPDHPDAQNITLICDKLKIDDLTVEEIEDIRLQLEEAIDDIKDRLSRDEAELSHPTNSERPEETGPLARREALLWTDEMQRFLHKNLMGVTLRNANDLRDFHDIVEAAMHRVEQDATIANLEEFLDEDVKDIAVAAAARAELEAFKRERLDRLNRQARDRLLRIAALLTGTVQPADLPDVESAPLNGLPRSLGPA